MTLVNDVEIQGAFKQFGSNVVLDGVSLEVKQGELLTLLGPSGCGKTTTLNLIAGFLDADEGEVFIKGKKMNGIPTYKRGLGMVFQTYSLFPHMTVYENLDFGLKFHNIPKADKKVRIDDALDLVRMRGLENRYPRELSGGQRQRIAIARALVVRPKLLLLDEPLSNLDAKLRQELRQEMKRMQKEVGVTTIFVTHDQEEALSMSDRIIVMNKGRIEQIGTPTEIYDRPKTEFVFQFVGKSNVMVGQISTIDEERITVELASKGQISVQKGNVMGDDQSFHAGDQVKLYIRPEKIVIGSNAAACENQLQLRITQMNFLGTTWEIEMTSEGNRMQGLSPMIESDWQSGSEVSIGWKSSDMMLIKK